MTPGRRVSQFLPSPSFSPDISTPNFKVRFRGCFSHSATLPPLSIIESPTRDIQFLCSYSGCGFCHLLLGTIIPRPCLKGDAKREKRSIQPPAMRQSLREL